MHQCLVCGYMNDDMSAGVCPQCSTPYPADTMPEHQSIIAPVPIPPPPPGAITTPVAPPVAAMNMPARSRRTIIISVVIGLVALVLITAGIAYAVTNHTPATVAAVATATPVPRKNTVAYQTYTDPNHAFTMKVPSTWQVNTNSSLPGIQSSVTEFTGSQKQLVGLYIIHDTQGISLQQINSVVTQLQGSNFIQSAGPTTTTLKNGTSWQVEKGSFTDSNGKVIQIEAAISQQNSLQYLLVAFGPGNAFSNNNRLLLLFLRSFQATP